MLNQLLNKVYYADEFKNILSAESRDIFIYGQRGTLTSLIINFFFNLNKKVIYFSDDFNKLIKIKDDINSIYQNEFCLLYSDKFEEEYENDLTNLSAIISNFSDNKNYLFLATPSIFNLKLLNPNLIKEYKISINTGDTLSYDNFINKLIKNNFIKTKIIQEHNEFAVRGGIIDIFPENLELPVRIEFYGDTIESIREFDVITQRSIKQINNTDIFPSEKVFTDKNSSSQFFYYISDDCLLIIDEPDLFQRNYPELFIKTEKFKRVFFSGFPLIKNESLCSYGIDRIIEIYFNSKSQPSFNSNIYLFLKNITELIHQNYELYITCSDSYHLKRTKELIEEIGQDISRFKINYLDHSFHDGFIFNSAKLAIYTEHEIFNRYFKPAYKKRKFSGISFRELSKINYGDFMVHQYYGIGKYAGLQKISAGGIQQEAVKLLYQDNDIVYVNLNSINLIKKYSAQEGVSPKLSKLGTNQWERIKQRTKNKIQEIAADLIKLYSYRKTQKGFKFSKDTIWQKELEASFIYEDTADQITAVDEIKKDMESDYPMDRLICGDVGFGKTEVAIRAAFKAVLDNKQVAVLVPTTILAEQHYNTFKDRLSKYAVEVEHLSRFKTQKQQNEILQKIQEGKINIIIGTHRLLSNDVKFKDIGLLIIDEEQRFGVKAKEKLKFLKENIDVLTLTATPIPRTLNFSLLGARDLSIINTPPKNRQPIHTEIINFNKKIISDAINYELSRNGQVYFVNDVINDLDYIAQLLEEITPAAKVAIAHGKMKPSELEKVMMGFLEKKYNVLVCTKIIESGLDIPNVNTIIINRADKFGLAELYQLRGRVGRTNIKSYAYLIAPPNSILTKQAIRRLHALEEFTELGSGLNLALKDLEIRGAGNLLGKEQSGFIAEIGFDLYMKILDEAVSELKINQSKEIAADLKLFKTENIDKSKINNFVIESDINMLIPDFYIDDENIRLDIYQKLADVTSFEEITEITQEMIDRFGKLPDEVLSLFNHIKIKIILSNLGFEKIIISKNSFELILSLDNQSFFESEFFEKFINYLNNKFSNNSKIFQSKKTLNIKISINSYINPLDKITEILSIIQVLNSL